MTIRVGRFLPEGGKKLFSMVKTGLAKILIASKNSFFVGKNSFMRELSSK